MKNIYLVILVAFTSYGQSTKEPNYPTIQLGASEWMLNNLNVTKFNNGEPINFAKTYEDWEEYSEQKIPAYTFSKAKCQDCEKEILYNYYVLIDERGILPAGFDFPSDSDFVALSQEFSLNTEKIKSFNFKESAGVSVSIRYKGYEMRGAFFWFKDENYTGMLEFGMGQSYGIINFDTKNECPNNFPLTCDGKWYGFKNFYETGGSNAGDGKSIRLVKK